MLAGGELSPPSLRSFLIPGADRKWDCSSSLPASLPALLLSGGEPSAQPLMSPGFAGSSDPRDAPGPTSPAVLVAQAVRGFSSALVARLSFPCAQCLLLVLVLLSHHSSCRRKAAAPSVLPSSFPCPWLTPWSRTQLQESRREEARGPMASAGPSKAQLPRAGQHLTHSSLLSPPSAPGCRPAAGCPWQGCRWDHQEPPHMEQPPR